MIKHFKVKSKAEMGELTASYYEALLRQKKKRLFAFATGSTPVPLYDELVRLYEAGRIDFSEVTTVNLDEYVGLDVNNENSYRSFMDRNLFDRVNIRKENTFLPDGLAKDVALACSLYSAMLERLGTRDVQLLGIGNNGHIGFNEPSDRLSARTFAVCLTESTIAANSRFFASYDEVPKKAMTMGMAEIFDSDLILLLASGKAKHDVLQAAIYGPVTTSNPASLLQLHQNVVCIDATSNDL